ncbi:MAG: TIGR02757 family protein [Spirochaetes bacterium]|nr:TIGR02757 family protein [Spirochaetota bacterium]
MRELKKALEAHYRAYNRRRYVHPDPLEFLYSAEDPADQEIVGLIAACLAYGRVNQILASVGRVLDVMGSGSLREGGPRAFLERTPAEGISRMFEGFSHRFTTGRELAALLTGVKRALADHGSLEVLFAAGADASDQTVLPALARFVGELRSYAGCVLPSLLPSPADGSACKRLNLFLRWMARRDAVDPGPWTSVPAAKLVVPLDTHMFRISRALGLTARKQADLKSALEITRGFRAIRPDDPVRYDFSLTRLALNPACRENGIECLFALAEPASLR